MTKLEAAASKGRFSGWSVLSICAAIFLILIFQLSVNLYRVPKGALSLGDAVSIEVDGAAIGSGVVPLLFSSGSDPDFKIGTYRFTMDFPAGGKAIGGGDELLVIPQIAGSSLEARLNGVLLGVRGDPAKGRSSLWNAAHVMPIDPGVLAANNRLNLDILGTYEAGITLKPYIVDGSLSSRTFWLLLISDYLIWISIGGILTVSLIIFAMGVYLGGERSSWRLLGAAGLCVAILLLDFAHIDRLPISLVAFKRLVVCARYLSAGIFILAYTKILKKKQTALSIGFGALQAACFLLVLLYPGTIVDIKRLYGWTYLVFIPFLAYLLYLVAFSGRVDRAFRILVFGVAVAFLGSLRDIFYLVIFKNPGVLMISQYGFVVLVLCSAAYVVDDSLASYRDLVTERRRTAGLREESIRDSLTEAYNRKILPVIVKELRRPYAVLVIDLDNLKMVNDEYGHTTGDAILIDLVCVLKRSIRVEDAVIRMGGDEFVVVLRACPSKIACEIAGRLEGDCAKAAVPVVTTGESRPESQGNLSYSVSIGIAADEGEGQADLNGLSSMIDEADKRMYKAKQAGKGIFVYE
ncbi:MAG: GGDEF domain-containing protein [Spirochaetes bacterium]|nr:GGDEF domain-containing protein [Spirochaetota bacterium]